VDLYFTFFTIIQVSCLLMQSEIVNRYAVSMSVYIPSAIMIV